MTFDSYSLSVGLNVISMFGCFMFETCYLPLFNFFLHSNLVTISLGSFHCINSFTTSTNIITFFNLDGSLLTQHTRCYLIGMATSRALTSTFALLSSQGGLLVFFASVMLQPFTSQWQYLPLLCCLYSLIIVYCISESTTVKYLYNDCWWGWSNSTLTYFFPTLKYKKVPHISQYCVLYDHVIFTV